MEVELYSGEHIHTCDFLPASLASVKKAIVEDVEDAWKKGATEWVDWRLQMCACFAPLLSAEDEEEEDGELAQNTINILGRNDWINVCNMVGGGREAKLLVACPPPGLLHCKNGSTIVQRVTPISGQEPAPIDATVLDAITGPVDFVLFIGPHSFSSVCFKPRQHVVRFTGELGTPGISACHVRFNRLEIHEGAEYGAEDGEFRLHCRAIFVPCGGEMVNRRLLEDDVSETIINGRRFETIQGMLL